MTTGGGQDGATFLVLGTAYLIVSDLAEAEDLIQETLLKLAPSSRRSGFRMVELRQLRRDRGPGRRQHVRLCRRPLTPTPSESTTVRS